MAGTSIDLRALVRRGEFLEELLDVLTEHEIDVPPLRERRDDIRRWSIISSPCIELHSGRPELAAI